MRDNRGEGDATSDEFHLVIRVRVRNLFIPAGFVADNPTRAVALPL